ncbi:MAG: DNA-formamidopyrimidine glycosylase [Erysipelotrichia bacterium]|nr:DNA-formamidopyrimidine glycosylase [Erysipelotrichia bacterium]
MPELPEVETVVRTLETLMVGCSFTDALVHTPSIVYHNEDFASFVAHHQLQSFKRRGKYILLGLGDNTLIIHLRMEGRFFINHEFNRPNKHVHVSFKLSDGRVLHYQDTRKFGRMLITHDVNQTLAHLGLEYDDPHFTVDYLIESMKNKKTSLKAFLLSQSVICGLGNIYSDEVCFRSRLHPEKRVSTLTLNEVQSIHREIKLVLSEAIALGGSSIRTYTNAMGIDGLFQLQLQVHMRAKQPCLVCGQIIEKTSVANRGTYVCKQCQKL